MARQFRCPRCSNLHAGVSRSPGALSVVCITCVPGKSPVPGDGQPIAPLARKRAPAKRKKVSL